MNKSIIALFLLVLGVSCTSTQKVVVQETQSGEQLFTKPLGIAPFTFRRSFPNGVAATLDTIQSMGFTEIEGGGGRMDAHEYKKLCDDRGLKITSMGSGYGNLLNNPQPTIDRAKIYGAKYIMAAWIPHDVGNFNFENAKKAAEDFNTIGKKLKENGITFCYHAHGYELVPYEGGEGTLLDYLMENTDPEYVSFEMDIYWIQFGGGNPTHLLKKYPNRWKLMHIKDLRKGTLKDHTGLTAPDNDVAVGEGELGIEGIIRAAQEIGVAHYFIEDESDRIITQIPKSISYLRSLKK